MTAWLPFAKAFELPCPQQLRAAMRGGAMRPRVAFAGIAQQIQKRCEDASHSQSALRTMISRDN